MEVWITEVCLTLDGAGESYIELFSKGLTRSKLQWYLHRIVATCEQRDIYSAVGLTGA